MRVSSLAVAIAVPMLSWAWASPGKAAQIVQNISPLTQDLGDFTPFNINALPFNPAVGALQDVTIELIGNYTPSTANDQGPFPATTTLTTRLFVFPTNNGSHNEQVDPLGVQTNVPVTVAGVGAAGIATGASTPVDQLFDFSTAADLAAFETGVPGTQLLLEYGFRTSNTLSCLGGCSDLTSFSGSGVLTYTYAQSTPEPAGVLVLGMGLAGLGWMRRRMSHPR